MSLFSFIFKKNKAEVENESLRSVPVDAPEGTTWLIHVPYRADDGELKLVLTHKSGVDVSMYGSVSDKNGRNVMSYASTVVKINTIRSASKKLIASYNSDKAAREQASVEEAKRKEVFTQINKKK